MVCLLQRLFKRDGRRFNKYVRSTAVHGVKNIFTGKSKIRRFLWLLIVLSAAIGCTYNIVDRIVYLADGPTLTTVSILENDSIEFPAITLCNLNLIKKSFLDSASADMELRDLVQRALYTHGVTVNQECSQTVNKSETEHKQSPKNLSLQDLLWYGRHTAKETIFSCRFMEQQCNASDFVPSLMPSGGVCYTFNRGGGTQKLVSNGTGTRFALTLVVYVQQHEYNAGHNQDAGIKIAIHPQSEPPQPDELGIAVAPGKNAFISMRQTDIENKSTKRKCRDKSNTKSFNFLQEEFPYSVPACQIDCLQTKIAKNCKCLGASSQQQIPPSSQFLNLQNCSSGANDVCCQVTQLSNAISDCNCIEACSKTFYASGASYSEFPAKYAVEQLSSMVNDSFNISANESFLKENFLGINVYFETLTIVKEVTSNAYDAVALLSDIGGQLALFLGASVISVLEFATWIFDEVKDRCFGIGERKIVNKFKSRVRKQKKGSIRDSVSSENNTGYQMDDYTDFDNHCRL